MNIKTNIFTLLQSLKKALLFLTLIFSLVHCKNKNKENEAESETIVTVVRTPGEFEPQEATWIIWSPVNHKKGMSNENTQLEIIEALVEDTKVVVVAKNDSLLNRAKNQIPKEYIDQGKVELKVIDTEEFWIRDMGPNFVELSNGKKGIVDFNFDAWGYTPHDEMDDYTILMEKFDEKVGELLELQVITTDVYSEGGDREVNGKGTLMVVEAVEMNRNPGKTLEELNAEFRRVLGVSNIIWLKQGVYEDDHTFEGPINIEGGKKAYTVITTGGHIDEFARFVDANTILLAEVPDEDLDDLIAVENKKRLEVNYNILKNAKDQDGKPFNIIRVPTPKTILNTMEPGDAVYDFISTLEYKDNSTFPTGEKITVVAASSYLNFTISNNVVVAQKYWKEGGDLAIKKRDEDVKKILEEVMPGRKIIMIDPLPINYGGGGIHCTTRHQPQ